MGLSKKVAELERGANAALTVAQWWKNQIATRGEPTAEAFYKSLGLNHLETKSTVEWEGLKLSRQPSEVEKLCIKSIAQAQDAGKEKLTSILLQARTSLINSALSAIRKLTPATYHKLILTMPDKYHDEVREQLDSIFGNGRKLVASELARQKGKSITDISRKQSEDDDALDDLADLTDARIANDIQSRITAAASRFTLLGLAGKALWDAVSKEVGDGSTGWLDRIATGATNKALNMGRAAEAGERSNEWERVEYSAILDSNVCEPCAADDGQTSTNEDDLSPAPNPECVGGDWCRCFHVYLTL